MAQLREATLILGALAASLIVQAQEAPKVYRVGIVANLVSAADLANRAPSLPARPIIEGGLRDLGWIDGKNVQILWKTAEGDYGRWPALMEQFVRLPVDVLVVFSDAAAGVAVKTTKVIPIVMLTAGPVVEDGLVASLARPGRNLTGMSFDAPKALTGKRLALLKEVAPSVSRVAVLIESIGTPGEHEAQASSKETLAAANALGLTIIPAYFTRPEQLEQALASVLRQGANGLLFSEGIVLNQPSVQERIHAFAAQNRLPVLHSIQSAADSGGLMSYGVDAGAFYRRAPYFIDRILRGAKPGELPIEQPDRFHLVVNLKAAKFIGLQIPPSLLSQADRVIE